ncbi:MerR family transcriptional regulator [Granulicoccus phenolivorans]|uniref:MerR family transcriptional regulator n=1 Tax=Granulicoccus phenolivorans TaxID=266854 RepID=UPI00040F907A|nr:MerR family transcriptional regulator [Granulicoccus phenolivorans]
MKIGEVAGRFGVETSVLRFWEEAGLLYPERDGSGYRSYTEADLVRVAVIIRNRWAGMSVERIGALLDADTPGRHRILEGHLADLAAREREIVKSREMTEHALRCESHDIVHCGRFASMVADLIDGTAPEFAWDGYPIGGEPVGGEPVGGEPVGGESVGGEPKA